MAEPRIPEGFTLVEAEPRIPEGFTLAEPRIPEGFTPVTQAPRAAAPAAPPYMARGAEPEIEDPAERAALRLQRGVKSPYKEGPVSAAMARVGEFLGRAGAHVLGTPQRAMEASAALSTGQLTPEEAKQAAGAVFEGATLGAPASAAMGTGKGIARAWMQQSPAAQAEHVLGVNIPRGIEGGPTKAAASQVLAAVPWSGRPLRRAGQEATEQLQAAGPAAAEMAAGRQVVAEEGGDIIRRSVVAALKDKRLDLGEGGVGAVAVSRLSNEGALDTFLNLAASKSPGDLKALGQIRASVAAKDWELVSGSLIGRLGRGAGGAFDPALFTTNWRAMAPQAKSMSFNREVTRHLDTIAEVSSKYGQRLERITEPGKLSPGVKALGFLGAVTHPVAFLSGFVGPRGMAHMLARPSNAASVAQWTKTYDRLLSHPAPGAVAAFAQATRNLSNTLGENIDVRDMLIKLKDSLPDVELQLGLPPK